MEYCAWGKKLSHKLLSTLMFANWIAAGNRISNSLNKKWKKHLRICTECLNADNHLSETSKGY